MNEMNGYDVEDMVVGMSASFSKTLTEADIMLFAGVSKQATQAQRLHQGARCRNPGVQAEV